MEKELARRVRILDRVADSLHELHGVGVTVQQADDWAKLVAVAHGGQYTLQAFIDAGVGRLVLDWSLYSASNPNECIDAGRGAIDRELDSIGDILDVLP